MQRPSWLQANMSVGNIVSITMMLLAVGSFYGLTVHRLGTMTEDIAALTKSVAELPTLAHRVTATEAQLAASNDRMDRAFSSFSERLDRSAEASASSFATITGALASLDTRIAVLTQRVESQLADRRTDLREANR